MTADTTLLMLLVIAILPITGALLAIIPFLVKKSEVFAVTVPEDSVSDPFIVSLKRRYALIVGGSTLAFTVLALVLLFAASEIGVIASMSGGLVVVCLGSYGLMLYFRMKVRAHKTSEGWEAESQEKTAVVAGLEIPRPVSLLWNLLYVTIICVTAAIGWFGFYYMPEQIPLQLGFNGEISSVVERSTLVIWIPVAIQVFLGLCFFSSHWIITRSKHLTDPTAPAASAFAYGMFAHAQSIYLVVGGLALAASMVAMPLTFMGVMSLMQASVLILLAALILIVGAMILAVVYGQGGARVFERMQESTALLADEDKHWKLGIFYFNGEDPSWFLPARFGIGWTCNFARPIVWVMILGLVLVSIAFVVIIFALT